MSDSVCELFGETIGLFGETIRTMVSILWLNVMVLFSLVGGALFDRPFMVFQRVCVCCACDPSVRRDAPSVDFVYVFKEFVSWIPGVFSLYVVSWCDFGCVRDYSCYASYLLVCCACLTSV